LSGLDTPPLVAEARRLDKFFLVAQERRIVVELQLSSYRVIAAQHALILRGCCPGASATPDRAE
jgi:hypothetical protein